MDDWIPKCPVCGRAGTVLAEPIPYPGGYSYVHWDDMIPQKDMTVCERIDMG